MNAVRFLVSGKVQGVWFRASACEKALSLQLRGYARNLVDGRVEVVAQGQQAALDALESWLQRGPPLARVSAVHREALADLVEFDGFAAR
jgi:acylphosphatase